MREIETKIVSAEQLRVLSQYAVENDYDHIPDIEELDPHGYSLLIGQPHHDYVIAKVFAKTDGAMVPVESLLTVHVDQWNVLMSLTDYQSLKKALDIAKAAIDDKKR